MSESQRPSRITLIAAAVFISLTALLLWAHGNRLVLNNDEGIILDAAARMLHGQTLYRDFFGYMTPGSYWIQEAAFALFGVSIRSGRIVVILDFALQCAVLFWLTALLAGKKTAFAGTILFAAFQTSSPERPDFLLAQHRMDSAALALLSIVLCVQGQRHAKAWYWAAGGLLVTVAALCTPTVGSIAAVTLVWVCADRSLRRFLLPYCGGLAAGTLAILTVVTATGMLKPLVDQMAWLSRNYSSVNYMPYGSIIGGYGTALAGAAGLELAILALVLFCVALPAVLPVAAIAAWTWAMFDPRWTAQSRQILKTPIPYLLGCMAVLVAGTYPRADVAHLAFVAVLPYVLAAAWISWHAPPLVAAGVAIVLSTVSLGFVEDTATHLRAELPVATPIGTVRASPADLDGVRKLLGCVHPGDTLYIHPYRPMLYFLTQTHNPTRYSYLWPGLMTSDDEAAALRDLEKMPPKAVMYLQLERAEYLRVFPNAYNLNHRFPRIEDWIAREYVPAEPPVWLSGYRLYLRATRTAAPASRSCTTEVQ
jgi:Dolichyl-phosphate-mannose-protein mannosyltransferase